MNSASQRESNRWRRPIRIAVLSIALASPLVLTGCRLLAAGAVGAGAGYVAGSAAADNDGNDDDDE